MDMPKEFDTVMSQAPVAIVGTTTWGTTLGLVLSRQGVSVRLLARTADEAKRLQEDGEHRYRLPGIPFPKSLNVTEVPQNALEGIGAIIFAVPSFSLRENARWLSGYLAEGPTIISACKGLERGSSKRMSVVLGEELSGHIDKICVLSGPNLAREIAAGFPASTVLASPNPEIATGAQNLFNSNIFRAYTNYDMLGVEVAGALKNIVALGVGISHGLGLGDNAKAALVTRGLAEISRFGAAMGANPLTFAGMAGLGDLVATCYSPLSRNRMVGEGLAQGKTLQQAISGLRGEVAEGVDTTAEVLKIANRLGVEMPIAQVVADVLFEWKTPQDAVAELMSRPPKSE